MNNNYHGTAGIPSIDVETGATGATIIFPPNY